MEATDTPFLPAWWGQSLPNARPQLGTYGRYPGTELPKLPFELTGSFSWLLRQPIRSDSIAKEKTAENAVSLAALLKDTNKRGIHLPQEFRLLASTIDLQKRIRSCTDCFFDLSPAWVPCPDDDGLLLRFLADSQGCIFWYLYQKPGSLDHCVVASPDFYGTEQEEWQVPELKTNQIVFSEQSFERFICRFWLENEIWYCDADKRPMFPEGYQYLDSYRQIT